MGEVKVWRLYLRLHAFSSLPGSGHPLNSALGTERACKRDREEKRSLAKVERREGGMEERNQFTGQRKHLNKRCYCRSITKWTNSFCFTLERKEDEVKLWRETHHMVWWKYSISQRCRTNNCKHTCAADRGPWNWLPEEEWACIEQLVLSRNWTPLNISCDGGQGVFSWTHPRHQCLVTSRAKAVLVGQTMSTWW